MTVGISWRLLWLQSSAATKKGGLGALMKDHATVAMAAAAAARAQNGTETEHLPRLIEEMKKVKV